MMRGRNFTNCKSNCNSNCVQVVKFMTCKARLKIIVPGPTYTLQKNHKKKKKDTKRKTNKNTCQQFIIYTDGTNYITYKFYIFGTFHLSENMENKEKFSQNSNP